MSGRESTMAGDTGFRSIILCTLSQMDGLAVSFHVMFQFLFSSSCMLIDVYVCSYVSLMYDMFSSHVYD